MIALRPLHWPDDRASLLALDTSFTTDRVFHLQQTNHGFKLDEAAVEPSIHKSHHLYVTREALRIGVGRALVTAAIEAARDRNARCVWVETQTVNYAAVRFYRSMGFEWVRVRHVAVRSKRSRW